MQLFSALFTIIPNAFIMKIAKLFITLIFVLESFSKLSAQISYPCGTYFLSLNGTSDRGLWDRSFTDGDFTLSTWFQLRDSTWQGKEMDFFHRYSFDFSGTDNLALFIGTDGVIQFKTFVNKDDGTGKKLETLSSGVKPEPFKWHHVALSYEATGNCRLYYDGKLAASGSFGGKRVIVWTIPGVLAIGSKYITGTNGGFFPTFKGYIDEIAFCQKALNGEEVNTLARGLQAGDPFLSANNVYTYKKNDTNPNSVNSGTMSNVSNPIVGQLYQCTNENQSPVADAGLDQVVILPAQSITLDGSKSSDSDGTITKYTWEKVSGPAGEMITDFNSKITSVTGLKEGTYVFRLTITDNNSASGTDEITITVSKVYIVAPDISMILDNGLLNTDISKINLDNVITGAATDGVTKVLIVINSSKEMAFYLDNPRDGKDGHLHSLTDQVNSESPIVITPKDGKIVCVYKVPDGYGEENPKGGRNISIKMLETDRPSDPIDINLKLVTPPVVLVHGMWSSPNTAWVETGFKQHLEKMGFGNIQLVNYEQYSHYTFDPNNPQSDYAKKELYSAIQRAIRKYKDSLGVLASQVDVVGHSLGGLVTRSFIQWKEYNMQPQNYNEGYIHKLITLGTPHMGSPLGPLLYGIDEEVVRIYEKENLSHLDKIKLTVLQKILQLVKQPVGSVHKDFNPDVSNNSALKHIASTAEYKLKKVHAVVGIASADAGDIFDGMEQFVKLILRKKSLIDVFSNSSEHDLVVGKQSQLGGLKLGNAAKSFSNTTHSNPPGIEIAGYKTETSNKDIFEHVSKLLQSADLTSFAEGFPAPSETSKRENRKALEKKASKKIRFNDSAYIRLNDESKGIIISQKQTEIEISFKTFNNAVIQHPLCLIENIGWFSFPEKAPYTIKIPVPGNVAGKVFYSILARDTSGVLLADTSYIQFTPRGSFMKLEVEPYFIQLDSMIKESQVSATAYYTYNGDTLLYRIDSTTGLKYKHHTKNIEINSDGSVQALQPGFDTLEVSYKNQIVHIPVEVNGNFSLSIKMSNIISFDTAEWKLNESPYGLNATSSSGNEVNFELLDGPAEIQNGIIILKDIGTVTIKATSKGNAYFQDAEPVIRSFNVLSNESIYYSKSTGDLHDLSTWGVNEDGSGETPVDFGEGKSFVLANRMGIYTMTGNWAIEGVLSNLSGNKLEINGHSLSLANLTGDGIFSGSEASNLTINGSAGGDFGTINFKEGAGGSLKTLTLNRSGESSSVSIGTPLNIYDVLTVTKGTLNTGDNLILKSSAINTARVAPVSGNITGNVIVERYIPARRAWRLMSAPITGDQNINQAWQEGVTLSSPNPNPYPGYGTIITKGAVTDGFDQNLAGQSASILSFNTSTNAWINIKSTYTNAVNKMPYFLFVRGDRSVTTSGAKSTTLRVKGPLKQGDQKIEVHTTGFTAIANPYASPLNFATITRNNIDNNFYVWDPKMAGSNGVGAYVSISFNGTGYDIVPSSVSPESQYIQSGQGFLVHSSGGGSLVIKESDKAATSAQNVFKYGDKADNKSLFVKAKNSYGIRINLQALDTLGYSLVDEVFTSYSNQFSNDIDGMDVRKLDNVMENLSLNRKGDLLIVERRSDIQDSDTLFLQISNTKNKQYLLEIAPVDMEGVSSLILEDSYTHSLTNVSTSSATQVHFEVNADPASFGPQRFKLILSKRNKAQNPLSKDGIKLYPNPVVDGNIYLELTDIKKGRYSLELINNIGQVVTQKTIQHFGKNITHTVNLGRLSPKGVYHVRITGDGLRRTIKLIVK